MDVQRWFADAAAMDDAAERAAAMEDLACDVRSLTERGRRWEAVALCRLLETLDPHDDLLEAPRRVAGACLVALGVRTLPSVDALVAASDRRFADLPEHSGLTAVARTLVRQHGRRRPEVWPEALALMERAASAPLGAKDRRLLAELRRRSADGAS